MALANMNIRICTRHHKVTGIRQSSVAGSAYRAGENLRDELADKTHSYRNRAKDVWDNFILSPEGAPEWAKDRTSLWNANELANKRKDSQLYRDVRVSLQRELPLPLQKELISAFVQEHFVSKGMVADIAIHADNDNHNPHAHIMLTMNHLEQDGFGKKNREWNEFIPLYDAKKQEQWGKALHATDLRSDLGKRFNEAFEDADSDIRIDYSSYEKQGLNRHGANMPREAIALEEKGIRTESGDKASLKKALNSAVVSTEIFEAKLENQYNVPDRQSFIQRTHRWWSGFLDKVQDLPDSFKNQWDALFQRQAVTSEPTQTTELE